jgi:hypothetical protein
VVPVVDVKYDKIYTTLSNNATRKETETTNKMTKAKKRTKTNEQ